MFNSCICEILVKGNNRLHIIALALITHTHIYIYIYIYICIRVVCVGIVFASLYLYVSDEGSLLPKNTDCTTPNGFELYLMRCGVIPLLFIIYIYICTHMYIHTQNMYFICKHVLFSR